MKQLTLFILLLISSLLTSNAQNIDATLYLDGIYMNLPDEWNYQSEYVYRYKGEFPNQNSTQFQSCGTMVMQNTELSDDADKIILSATDYEGATINVAFEGWEDDRIFTNPCIYDRWDDYYQLITRSFNINFEAGTGTKTFLYDWQCESGSVGGGRGSICAKWKVIYTYVPILQASTPSVQNNGCNPILDAIAPTQENVTWYWQTSATGTDQTYTSDNPPTAQHNTTYYLRPFGDRNLEWGSASAGVLVTKTTINTSISTIESSGNTANDGFVCFGEEAILQLDAAFTNYAWSTGSSSPSISVSNSGDYTVTVTDNNGCTISVTASIIANPEMKVGSCILATDDCQKNEGIARVEAIGGSQDYTFQYIPSNLNLQITEQSITNGSEYIIENIPGATIIDVQVTDSNGCQP